MRKKSCLLLIMVALCSLTTLFGCNAIGGGVEDSDVNLDNKIEVNNNQTGTSAEKFVIEGAEDLHIAKTVTDISNYTEKVQAVSDSNKMQVTVDDSGVNYGVKGEYNLIYKYNDISKTVKVTVYDLPQIEVAESATTEYLYSKYYLGVTDGISAEDCFGNALDVRLYDSKGAENADGSLNVGTYTMQFAAVDTAGQIVYIDKTVTIAAEQTPQLDASYVYDVANENFEISLNEADYDLFLSVSLEGSLLPTDVVLKENNKLIIDGDYLYATYAVDSDLSLRVITAKGSQKADFTITDVGVVAYDDAAIQDFAQSSYECFATQEIPQILLTNEKQSVTPIYTLKKDGEQISTGREVEFTTDGAHTLEITLREGQTLTYTLSAYFNLGFVSGAAYLDTEGMNTQLNSQYTLKKYTVYNYSGQEVLTYAPGGNFEEFNTQFKQLSKKQSYVMQIDALASNQTEVSQKIDFTLINAQTTEILTDSLDGDERNVVPYDTKITSLKYVATSLGGRVGAYKWSANKEANTTSTILKFNEKFSTVLKKGTYLTFDIYAEKPISLTWCGAATNYMYNDVSGLTNVKFYNAAGQQLTSGSFWNGNFKNQWITIELKLDEDYNFTSNWRGLTIWSSGLYANNVYLANIKASTESFLAQAEENVPSTPDTPVTTKEGIILANESDLSNITATNSPVNSISYVAEGAGRTGVFKWATTSDTNIGQDNAALKFTKTANNEAWLKKDSYLVFDIYVDATVRVSFDSTFYFYATGASANDRMKVYDEEGNLITSGSIWTGEFLNKWVTFEIKMDKDYNFDSNFAGFYMYNGTQSNFNSSANVYLDNVRVSTTSMSESN